MLENPVEGIGLVVTSPFNVPRSYGPHEGIDLRATDEHWQPVNILAGEDGQVIRASDKKSDGTPSAYGWHVILDHGDGWRTWYCHMERLYVQLGDLVEAGDPLGLAGSTGNSTGIHLHLNVQHIGHGLSGYVVADVLDPAPFLGLT